MTNNEKKTTVLAMIQEIGENVKRMSQTNYWRWEDHDRAKPYQLQLPEVRKAWMAVKNARTIGEISRALGILKNTIRTGIESNIIRNAEEILRK